MKSEGSDTPKLVGLVIAIFALLGFIVYTLVNASTEQRQQMDAAGPLAVAQGQTPVTAAPPAGANQPSDEPRDLQLLGAPPGDPGGNPFRYTLPTPGGNTAPPPGGGTGTGPIPILPPMLDGNPQFNVVVLKGVLVDLSPGKARSMAVLTVGDSLKQLKRNESIIPGVRITDITGTGIWIKTPNRAMFLEVDKPVDLTAG